MGIVEKMQNWDTWEDIVKDSDPYLNHMLKKYIDGDFSIIDEYDDFKKFVDRLNDEFQEAFEECLVPIEAFTAAVDDMSEIYKTIADWDKFNNLLTSETALTEFDKRVIVGEWEEHHAINRTKVDTCLVSETIEERLKNKSVEVSEARFKVDQLYPRKKMIGECVTRAKDLNRWIVSYFIDVDPEYGLPLSPSRKQKEQHTPSAS